MQIADVLSLPHKQKAELLAKSKAELARRGIVNLRNRLYGGAKEIFECEDEEAIVVGPAGTGKSVGTLTKIHYLCERYAKIRCLILRKFRSSLTESGLVTFETKIVPDGHPILASGGQRNMRQHYVYPNGSEIVIGGLDNPTKIMSTDYDLIYIQEAIEVEESDWETASTRLRNGVLPFQQIMADTNPDRPTHWLNQRCTKGLTRRILSTHEDNPIFFDHETGEWTEAGLSYLAKLDRLTGPRKARLRHGIWAGAEGTIYEEVWNPSIHVIDRFDIPNDWPRFWVVDFGFVHPFVWNEWAIGPDGEMYRTHEIHMTKRLVEDHAKQILSTTEYWRKGGRKPTAIICDHDAEDRATLERHLGMRTQAATKTVSDGIQAVASRLKVQGNGKTRMFFFSDGLVEVDREAEDQKRPTDTISEFDGYVWDTSGGKKLKDAPLKIDDDGMDVTRYAVAHLDMGRRRIKVY